MGYPVSIATVTLALRFLSAESAAMDGLLEIRGGLGDLAWGWAQEF